MKKFTVLLLAALIALSAVGCAKDTPAAPTTITTAPTTEPVTEPSTEPVTEPPIIEIPEAPTVEADPLFDPEVCAPVVGTWSTDVTIGHNYVNMPDFTGSATFTLVWTFSDDGNYSVAPESTSFSKAIYEYETLVTQYMMDGFYALFESEKKLEGLGSKKIQAAWEESGKAEATANTQLLLDTLALTDTFLDLVHSGAYYVENDTLYLCVEEDGYENFAFEIDEEGLILNTCSRMIFYNDRCIRFPLALTK